MADLTITEVREEAVDFSHPFMYLGLGVLVYKGPWSPTIQNIEALLEDENLQVGVGGYYILSWATGNSTILAYLRTIKNYYTCLTRCPRIILI